MEKNKNVPKIRFKGYSQEWEEECLSDSADIIGGGTPSTSIKEYWDGDIDWYSPAEIGNKIFVGKSQRRITELGLKNSSAKILPVGTVLFSSRAGIGNTAILIKAGATNQGFQSIVPHINKLDTYFIFSRTSELKRYGEINGAGSTFIEVSGKQMACMPILNPEFEEQQQIGNYFQNIDKLIEVKQSGIDKLKNIKKACLEKMFPKKGATTPEIRFKGFAGEWEEKELGDKDVTNSYSGGTPTVGVSEYYNGTIPFIRSGEINSDFTELFITSKGLENSSAKLVQIGDILYALYGATSGEVGISMIDGAINQAIMAIKPHRNYDAGFIAYWLRKEKNNIINTYLQGGQGNLSSTIVKELIIGFPAYDEQKLIGSFFKNLDYLIYQNEQQLTKLKNIKKASLEKMFVNKEDAL